MTGPTSSIDTTWWLFIFGGLAVVTVLVMIALGVRRRDIAPVALCMGALICAINEPVYDLLGKFVYAENSWVAFVAFDRKIPLFLVVGYVPWVAGISFWVSELMARGASRRSIHLIALASFVSVVVVETFGNLTKAWIYYGEPPLKYLGVAPGMAGVPIVCGALIYLLGTMLKGKKRILIGVVPLFALPAVFASSCVFMYASLHSSPSKPVQYLAGIASMAFIAVIVAATSALAARWRQGELALHAQRGQ
ncbi:hypothetical protein [Mycobacterium sp. AT1]|uniref:hypothetical protein n=1 Tax=Mycobacterium sp. AT1 TaxID=1961706 RepID=UPI0009AD1252|nr:hypothetical protein [Mycobacterium sp. AT1]OPX11973.1 hypothetical protein B1790_05885 [Mycobacterium sp. AT1]